MHPELRALAALLPQHGELEDRVLGLLRACKRPKIAEHVPRVAGEAVRLAQSCGVDQAAARSAALLHDIGGVCAPGAARVTLAEQLGWPVSPEERQVPMLLHAKLGVTLARELLGVTDEDVLQAIRYHTALHGQPSPLDQVVFLADKLEWDQGGVPPYAGALRRAIDVDGLEGGCRQMLTWLASPQARLLVVLPELRAAWTAYGMS